VFWGHFRAFVRKKAGKLRFCIISLQKGSDLNELSSALFGAENTLLILGPARVFTTLDEIRG